MKINRLPFILTLLFFCGMMPQCNYPTEVPAQTDNIPVALRNSPYATDLVLADSLAGHNLISDALDKTGQVHLALTEQNAVSENDLSWIKLKMAALMARKDLHNESEAVLDTIISRTPVSEWAAIASIEKGRYARAARSYDLALSNFLKAFDHASQKNNGTLLFSIARMYQVLNQFEHALEWYDRSAPLLPALADYVHFYAAECLTSLGRKEEAVKRLSLIIEPTVHSPFLSEALPDILDDLIRKKAYREVIRQSDKALNNSHWPDDDFMASLQERKARAYESVGEIDSVKSIYRNILENYRHTEAASNILSSFETLADHHGFSISDNELLQIGLVHLNHRRYGPAKVVFLDMLKQELPADVHPEALYYLNRIRYIQKSYKTALAGFRSLLEMYPDHQKAGPASFHVARCIRARQGINASFNAYLDYAETYPLDDSAPDALLFVADQKFKRKQYTEAAKLYHRIAVKYTGYKNREQAHWQEAYAYYRAGRYTQAAASYIALAAYDSTSAFAPRGLYWAGKALEKSGNSTRAMAQYRLVIDTYPVSYYAFRAVQKLNRNNNGKQITWLTGWRKENTSQTGPPALDFHSLEEQLKPGQDVSAEKEDYIHYTRAVALFEVGLRKEGEKELEWYGIVNPDNPTVQLDIMALYYKYGYYREGIRAASRLQRRLDQANIEYELPWQFQYPAPFWDFVQQKAEELNLDPLFILAVMRQESRFDYDIKSWAGAYGLMQLMPVTARSLAKQQRIKPYSTDRLLEPELNITLGSHYLVELLRRFKGRPELVLASYNGGPSRVARWVRQRGASDIDEFVEEISLDETRLFVKLVMRNYARYVSQYSARQDMSQ